MIEAICENAIIGNTPCIGHATNGHHYRRILGSAMYNKYNEWVALARRRVHARPLERLAHSFPHSRALVRSLSASPSDR